ncbi:hypothetical protein [Roseibium algae]|uniref:Uncharacterized protein n=1 Tax=Roseibium algae TaxID=3123038 RepID=A0ABU8TR60_9HYPH
MPKTSSVIDDIHLAYPALGESADWLLDLVLRKDSGEFAGLRKRLSPLVEEAGAEMRRGNAAKAANYISLAIVVDPKKTRELLGSTGIFRASKYNFDIRIPVDVVDRLVGEAAPLSMPPPIVQYLTSVALLLKAGKEVERLNKSLEGFLVRNRKTVLKSVVAVADSLFMAEHKGHPAFSSDKFAGYSKEELAEATSYIIHVFDRCVGISDEHFNNMGETGISRGLYSKILIRAAKIRAYCEAEILLDGFHYECERRGTMVRIVPPSPELEKSIRLGYAMSDQEGQPSIIARIRAIREGEVSILSLADSIYERSADDVVFVKHEPFSRYAFKFPDTPQFSGFFNQDGFTIEERLYLQEVLRTELVTWDDLKDFQFEGGVTFEGMLKVQRLFRFLARIASNHLLPRLETESEQVYRSLVPVFSKQKLQELLGWCVGKEEAESILRLMAFGTGSHGIIDIQYRPILDGGSHYLVPLHIAGSTNWYRNFAHTEKRRVVEKIEDDGTVKKLASCLRVASSMVQTEYETKLSGQKVELDVLCRFEDFLFIFENKHSLLPCNTFELRTSYKHMKTAATQLSKITNILSDEKTELELYRRLGWKVEPAKEVVTCIVSCNGMFSGLRMDGHPVRRFQELINMIETGYVSLNSVSVTQDEQGLDVTNDAVRQYYLWNSPSLRPQFLRDYIERDLLQGQMFDAMVELNRSFNLDRWQLEFQSYALDLDKVIEALDSLMTSDNRSATPVSRSETSPAS